MSFERFTRWRPLFIYGIIKSCQSPGRAGGFLGLIIVSKSATIRSISSLSISLKSSDLVDHVNDAVAAFDVGLQDCRFINANFPAGGFGIDFPESFDAWPSLIKTALTFKKRLAR
jgi:hypothetical protein